MADAPVAVVLVEGISDRYAVEAAAAKSGRDFERDGVAVIDMGGATNLGRHLAAFRASGVRVAGLCDLGEADFFRRALERAGMTSEGFFVCERDLEDELIRALGAGGVEAVIEREGELASLRRLQRMPFHRDRRVEDQLRRFLGSRSGRKHHYAPLFVDALDAADLPRPLLDLVAYATG